MKKALLSCACNPVYNTETITGQYMGTKIHQETCTVTPLNSLPPKHETPAEPENRHKVLVKKAANSRNCNLDKAL